MTSQLTDIKKQFPIFQNHPKLVYLYNASTTQKPQRVIDALNHFYTHANANVHRGVYKLSETATELFERTRDTIAKFINARHPHEIIFTKGTTESINAIAYTWGEQNITAGNEIVVSLLEHHSNFVPWQQLAHRKKAVFKVIPLTDEGLITQAALRATITERTKLVAVTYVSNVLGIMPPLEQIIGQAHKVGAKVLVDAAQAVAHLPVDVQKLDCDWLVFSGHKMYGPTGVGVLYGKEALLESMPPFLYGGGMNDAVHFLQTLEMHEIQSHEKILLQKAFKALQKIPHIQIHGPHNTKHCLGVISFQIEGIHAHDVATLADEKDVALRVGHHCAQPLMQHLRVPSTCRVSFGVYNNEHDIEILCEALRYAKTVFHL